MGSVGFIGLGMMGLPMAGILAKAGLDLVVHDAALAAVERFVAAYPGARKAQGLHDFAAADVVIAMLPNSDIVDAIVLGGAGSDGLVAVMRPGTTVIDMGSSQPMRSRVLVERLAAVGIGFLDAPVSGGQKRAVDGSLAIMVGGDKALFDTHHALLGHLGRTVLHVGPAGAGHAVKALNNYVSAAGLVAAAEALHVARQFGLDPDIVCDVFNSSSGKNYSTEVKVKPFMLSGTFDSGFALQLMAKDVRIAMNLGHTLGQPMPVGDAVLGVWNGAASQLSATADYTEMYRYLQKPAG